MEFIKIIILGIIEGITEWLPISSTAHMLIFDKFFSLNASENFKQVFLILVQLSAMLAVVKIGISKLSVIERQGKALVFREEGVELWLKIAIACVPGFIAMLLFDDLVEKNCQGIFSISSMLIVVGVIILIVEHMSSGYKGKGLNGITFTDALIIGVFQVLAIIPGTSRSGATIIGGLFIGINRKAIAEFTYYLSIPVMAGASAFKLIRHGVMVCGVEWLYLFVGMVVSFVVSLFVVKWLLSFVKNHSYKSFAFYRIVLGLILIIFSIKS